MHMISPYVHDVQVPIAKETGLTKKVATRSLPLAVLTSTCPRQKVATRSLPLAVLTSTCPRQKVATRSLPLAVLTSTCPRHTVAIRSLSLAVLTSIKTLVASSRFRILWPPCCCLQRHP